MLWLAAYGFFLRKLNTAKAKHSILDRELLTCEAAICPFICLVEGRAFMLYTDHKPLNCLQAKQADRWCRGRLRTASVASVASVTSVTAMPGGPVSRTRG